MKKATPKEAFEAVSGDHRGSLLDVRQPAEYRGGHVAGSRLIPLGELSAKIAAIDRSAPVYVLCRSGARAASAVAVLARQGFDARVIDGGILAWAAAGLPVEKGD